MPTHTAAPFPPPQSASRHAVERYQLHFPEAEARDVLTAAQLALPIPSAAAHALLGRTWARPNEENEHRLHLEGAGVFVLTRLPDRDHSYVITYLRLDGAEQRRIARDWFLQPLGALRAAFELGMEAGRGGSDLHPAAASEQAIPALLTIVAGLVPTLVQPAPPPVVLDAPPEPGLPLGGSGAAAGEGAPIWTEHALGGLRGMVTCDPTVCGDPERWQWVTEQGVQLLLTMPTAGQWDVDVAALVEPSGRAMAWAGRDGARWRVLRLHTVPRALRASLLEQRAAAAAPRSGAVSPASVPPASVAPTTARPAASPPAGPLQAAAPAEGAEPPPPPVWSTVHPSEVRVQGWDGRAVRQCGELGVQPVPPGWFDMLTPVPPDELPDYAARAGLTPVSGRAAAGWVHQGVLLLVAVNERGEGTVARAGRLR